MLATQRLPAMPAPPVSVEFIGHGGGFVGHVAVPRTPLVQPVIVTEATLKRPALHLDAGTAPEAGRAKRHGSDLGVGSQHLEDPAHVVRAIELVDVDLPQVVTCRTLCVGSRLSGPAAPELVPNVRRTQSTWLMISRTTFSETCWPVSQRPVAAGGDSLSAGSQGCAGPRRPGQARPLSVTEASSIASRRSCAGNLRVTVGRPDVRAFKPTRRTREFRDLLDYPCGVAGDDGAGRHVVDDDRPGAH